MIIRVLNELDASIYQEVRLNALKNSPDVFGSTYEREVLFTIEQVSERVKPSKEKFVLGAFLDNKLVGIVTFVREAGFKTNHKGNVFGMYVEPHARGTGVGKTLLQGLINEAKKYGGLEQINLTVVSNNIIAKSLYQSLGFVTYGVERNALKFNSTYFDEDLMVLNIEK